MGWQPVRTSSRRPWPAAGFSVGSELPQPLIARVKSRGVDGPTAVQFTQFFTNQHATDVESREKN